MFEKNISIKKLGNPSDTIYENYGVQNLEKYILIFMVVIIVYYFAGLFF